MVFGTITIFSMNPCSSGSLSRSLERDEVKWDLLSSRSFSGLAAVVDWRKIASVFSAIRQRAAFGTELFSFCDMRASALPIVSFRSVL